MWWTWLPSVIHDADERGKRGAGAAGGDARLRSGVVDRARRRQRSGGAGGAVPGLAFLAAVERSPNTVKAYAHDLKDWFTFLAGRGLDWQAVTLEDVAGFVAWLRLPPGRGTGGWRYCLLWTVTAPSRA